MAAHHSHDIFRLIHSLTKGEWSTLVDEVAKSQSIPGGKERTIKYLELIKYLRAQEVYDDENAKEALGYKHRKDTDWHALKREAIKHIMLAIERTRSNQTTRAILQKSPTEIERLIQKGLWKRADKKTGRSIEDAGKLELFEIQAQLLNLKQFIVSNSYPAEIAAEELDKLQARRNDARSRLKNIDLYQDLWYEVSSSAKAGDNKMVREILESQPMQEPELLSKRAKILFLQIQRRAAFVLELHDVHTRSINEGIKFCTSNLSNPEEYEVLILFAKLVFEKAREALGKKDFIVYEDALLRLEAVIGGDSSIPLFAMAAIKERILLLKVHHARIIGNRSKLMESVHEINEWFGLQKGYVGQDVLHRIAIACIDGLILFGELSAAIKWLLKIRNTKKSAFHPQISSAVWLIYLAIRYEQEEWEIIKSQISGTRSYLNKNEPDNQYYWALLKFFAKVAKNKGSAFGDDLESLNSTLQILSQKTQYATLGNYFDFPMWVQAKIEGKPYSQFLLEKLGG